MVYFELFYSSGYGFAVSGVAALDSANLYGRFHKYGGRTNKALDVLENIFSRTDIDLNEDFLNIFLPRTNKTFNVDFLKLFFKTQQRTLNIFFEYIFSKDKQNFLKYSRTSKAFNVDFLIYFFKDEQSLQRGLFRNISLRTDRALIVDFLNIFHQELKEPSMWIF